MTVGAWTHPAMRITQAGMQEGIWSRRDYTMSWLSQDAVALCKPGRQTVIEIDSNSVRTESMTLRIVERQFFREATSTAGYDPAVIRDAERCGEASRRTQLARIVPGCPRECGSDGPSHSLYPSHNPIWSPKPTYEMSSWKNCPYGEGPS